jgi:hypothetical protein
VQLLVLRYQSDLPNQLVTKQAALARPLSVVS